MFNRAVERGNLSVAESSARQMGKVSLLEALELTALIALKDPRRHGRAGTRWLARYLTEHPQAGLDEAAFAVGCLCALGGQQHEAALAALRATLRSPTVAKRSLRS